MAACDGPAYAAPVLTAIRKARRVFGFSIGKLLLFLGVVFVVWFGWKRMAATAQTLAKTVQGGDAIQPTSRDESQSRSSGPDTIELVRNPKTGQYEPADRD